MAESTFVSFAAQSKVAWGRHRTQTDTVSSKEDLLLGCAQRQASSLERIAEYMQRISNNIDGQRLDNDKLRRKISRLEAKLRKTEVTMTHQKFPVINR